MLMDEIKATDQEPRFHGIGFTQLYLSERRRLHVWHPDLPATISNGLIHDHSWIMNSQILKGCILHKKYHFEFGEGNESVWTPPPKHAGIHAAWFHHGSGKLIQDDIYGLAASSQYIFPAGEFHTVTFEEISVTVVEKTPHDEITQCRVVSHDLKEPEDAYAKAIPNGAMWKAIFEACYGM